jgi:hypothetical protein
MEVATRFAATEHGRVRSPLRAFTISMLLATTALAENRVAILPIQPRPGALSPRDAVALAEEMRAVASETLASEGYEVVAAEGSDPSDALEKTGAALAVLGRAAQMEGATVIAVSTYRPGSGTPVSLIRVMGIGMAQLRADVRAKLPNQLAAALGLAAPAVDPKLPPGTLRMPGGTKTPAPPVPQAAAPPPPPPPPAPTSAPPPENEDPLVTMIRETTVDVERLRGLRRKQNLKVQILDDKLFSAAVREKAKKEMTPAVVAAERARWLAFNLAPAAVDPAQVLLDVLDEQVAGFYDPFTRQLIVRKNPPASAGATGPDGLRVILAHEIEHALQDQNFGIPDMAALPDDDVRLARSALYEGDAMAVMTAFGALRAHKPIKAAIAGGAAMLKALDAQTLLKVSGKSPQLQHAPPVLREELVLPYAAGFALVAEAYRRGGFPLVDKMFKNPPVSPHQILHPDAYFAGETPAVVPVPAPPPGTQAIAAGRMGELGTRLALEACVEKEVAKEFVPRWAGDAYVIVEGPKSSLSLLWTTAWSSGVAGSVTNVMKLVQPCWEEQAGGGPNPLGWSIAPASRIAGSGDVVAVARGAVDLGAATARQLAARPVTRAPVPPLGDVPPPATVGPTRVSSGRFVSPRLALAGVVPEGFDADSSNPVAELAIKKAGTGGATISFVPEALTGEALDAFFQTASTQIAAMQGGHLTYIGKTQRLLAGAPAEQRSWAVENAGMNLRIEVAPYCGGKAALTLLRLEGGAAARATLDQFAASITQTGAAPACAELE